MACFWCGRGNWNGLGAAATGPWQHQGLGVERSLSTSLMDTFNIVSNQSCRTLFILGDPTLRPQTIRAPTVTQQWKDRIGNTVTLNWIAASDATLGYRIYKSFGVYGAGWSVAVDLPAGTQTWIDSNIGGSGIVQYCIRSKSLIINSTGSHYTMSPGLIIQVQ